MSNSTVVNALNNIIYNSSAFDALSVILAELHGNFDGELCSIVGNYLGSEIGALVYVLNINTGDFSEIEVTFNGEYHHDEVGYEWVFNDDESLKGIFLKTSRVPHFDDDIIVPADDEMVRLYKLVFASSLFLNQIQSFTDKTDKALFQLTAN